MFLILSIEVELKDKIKIVYVDKKYGFTAYVEDDEIHIVLKNFVKNCFARACQLIKKYEFL